MPDPRALDGPIGLVGACYIGHLFAQQFALAGYEVRAWSPDKEIPGFLWNRVWFAMLREMLHLVDIGAVDPLELDPLVQTTLRAFVPVFGPLQMTDLIGHDTLRDISNALYPELAADRTASKTIEQHVAGGRLGVKAGPGLLRGRRRTCR